jgi:serine/threonine protein kinase
LLGIKDFKKRQIEIGKGAFGEVFAVNCKLNSTIYALKRLDKDLVLSSGYDRIAMREKEILNMVNHQNIIRLDAYFHDSNY